MTADTRDTIARGDTVQQAVQQNLQQVAWPAGTVDMGAQAIVSSGGAAASAPAGAGESAFVYGWCRTDHKTGKEIRRDWRTTDYMNDEPYATRVHAMLEQLGLPKPRAEEVFRGTHHDLLFLNSHGVVIRIGPTDVEDLMNPGILQPLGWLEDKDNKIGFHGKEIPLTVAVYPGIELYENYDNDENKKKPPLVGDLMELLTVTKQGTGDARSDTNCGIIRVVGDDGHEVAVKMLLDPDNSFNQSSRETATRRSNAMQELAGSGGSGNKGEVLFNTLRDVFNAAKNVRYWERAFETHQPLRHMFWDAFKDVAPVIGLPDTDKRTAFWDKCASVTNKPEPVTLPLWRSEKTPDGTLSFARQDVSVPHLVLYRPWTGEAADRIIQPIQQTPELTAAVARAHAEKVAAFKQDMQNVAEDIVRKVAPDIAEKGLRVFGRKIWNGFVKRF